MDPDEEEEEEDMTTGDSHGGERRGKEGRGAVESVSGVERSGVSEVEISCLSGDGE